MIVAKQITHVKTQEQCGLWLLAFKQWCDQYEQYVNEKSFNPATGRYWFTHKNLHAAYILILKAIPDMFHHLNDCEIPPTTNRLETILHI